MFHEGCGKVKKQLVIVKSAPDCGPRIRTPGKGLRDSKKPFLKKSQDCWGIFSGKKEKKVGEGEKSV